MPKYYCIDKSTGPNCTENRRDGVCPAGHKLGYRKTCRKRVSWKIGISLEAK